MPETEWSPVAGKTLMLATGDITRVPADAIVNAANSALAGGGGVDGAIHRAGGPSIMAELDEIRKQLGQCAPGHAVATGAGRLDARYVFHTVGPIYRGGRYGEPELLAECHRTCLQMAEERGVRRIAFPSISTGTYGYPFDEAAVIAIREAAAHLARPGTQVEEVVFVLFGQQAYDAFARALAGYRHR